MLNRNIQSKAILTPGFHDIKIVDSSIGINKKGKEYAMLKLFLPALGIHHNVFINEYDVTDADGSVRTVTIDDGLASYGGYLAAQLNTPVKTDVLDYAEQHELIFQGKFETEFLNFSIPAVRVESKVTSEAVTSAATQIEELA
jgi:hypothetical protein